MKAFETTTTVSGNGQIFVGGVPFAPGTEVEVTISPKRQPSEPFDVAWQRIVGELRANANVRGITDTDIQQEIDAYRAGK
jgi:hypothetical protein